MDRGFVEVPSIKRCEYGDGSTALIVTLAAEDLHVAMHAIDSLLQGKSQAVTLASASNRDRVRRADSER